MPESSPLVIILILLAAAVVAVSLFRTLKISPILGYLAAGAIIGPGGTGLITDSRGTSDIAELGVVFLLFIIGLELSFERIKTIRKEAVILGLFQIILTAAIIYAVLLLFHFSSKAAIIIGCGLSLSSTALVMQLLAENNQKAVQIGRISLAVLLLQDLAVVPLLVLVPALSNTQNSIIMDMASVVVNAAITLCAIFIFGRLILRRVYRFIATLQNSEIFTAFTLLVVIGTSFMTEHAGLSLAFGAFVAGLMLAETEYRHQVEADVMPYKGLLLGLFFMSVGMSADLKIAWHHLPLVMGLAVLLVFIKSLIIMVTARLLGFTSSIAVQTGALLAQGGEFAFILFKLAAENNFFSSATANLAVIVVIISMVITPFTVKTGRIIAKRLKSRRKRKAEDLAFEMTDVHDHVIILGFGRVGQTIAKLLSAENIDYIALDMHIGTVSKAKKIGLPVYYGDGAQREVLGAIGIERASAAIITLNNPEAAEKAVHSLRGLSPTMPIIARAADLQQVLMLEAAGANLAIAEMFETSLQLGGALLKSLSVTDKEINRITQIFRDRDYSLARGTLESSSDPKPAAYTKMLAFQNTVVSGATTVKGK